MGGTAKQSTLVIVSPETPSRTMTFVTWQIALSTLSRNCPENSVYSAKTASKITQNVVAWPKTEKQSPLQPHSGN